MIQIFKAITGSIVLGCSAINRFMSAADHAGRYVEQAAADMADTAEEDREDKRRERAAKREAAGLPVANKTKPKALAAPTTKTAE